MINGGRYMSIRERYGIIYKITNKINGKVYIGQTKEKRGFKDRYNCSGVGIERVYKSHLSNKKSRGQCNEHLLNSIIKYGFEAFEVEEELMVAYSKEELSAMERQLISFYDANNPEYGYNKTNGGESGFNFCEESVKKLSNSHKMLWGDKGYKAKRVAEMKKYNCKKIICLNDNNIFESGVEASEYYDINKHDIYKYIGGEKEISESRMMGLKFMYYSEFKSYSEEEIKNIVYNCAGKREFKEKFKTKIDTNSFDWHDKECIKELLFIHKEEHNDYNDELYYLMLDLEKIIEILKNRYINFDGKKSSFSKQEIEVVDLIRRGYKITEIANIFGVKQPAITKVVRHIVEKILEYTLDNFKVETYI